MNKKLLLGLMVLVVGFVLVYLQGGITGLVTLEGTVNYTQELDVSFDLDGSYHVILENSGTLRSFYLSGSYIDGTNARVYLVYGDDDYLVLDTNDVDPSILSITGFVVLNESDEGDEENISIDLAYASNSSYDPNDDGIVSIDEIVDLTVSETSFAFDVDYSKLCTRWKINSGSSICYGYDECCSFLGLDADKEDWSSVFYVNYGLDDVVLENTVNTQVVYFDYSLDPSDPYSEVYYSQWSGLSVNFANASFVFDKLCDETCLIDIDDIFYTLVVEVDSGSITLDNFTYALLEDEKGILSGAVGLGSYNLSVWDETDSNAYKWAAKTRYPKQQTSFFANYTNNGLVVNGTGIGCNISFSDLTANMTWDGRADYTIYSYTRNFTYSGNYSYNVSCSDGITPLNTNDNVSITQPVAGFSDSGNGIQAGYLSSVVFADYDNDNNWDLIISGNNLASQFTKFYRNNGSGILVLDSNYNASNIDTGSLSFGDFDNDGDLDLSLTGFDGSNELNVMYKNNGSNLNTYQTLMGVAYTSCQLSDINKDGNLDFLTSGSKDRTDGGRNTSFYINNITNFYFDRSLNSLWKGSISSSYLFDNFPIIISSGTDGTSAYSYLYNSSFSNIYNLTGLRESAHALGDIDNDGDLDFIISGSITSDNSGAKTLIYENNGTNLNQIQSLNGAWYGSIALGDINNDGKMDLIVTGQNSSVSNNVFVEFYLNNGTNFTSVGSKNVQGIYISSIAVFDYDGEGDLDLAISGYTGAAVFSKLYNNNISSFVNNTPPNPPTTFTNNFDGIWLNMTWNNGTDDLTPKLGLYYNLRVSTQPYRNDIVSGKYGGSSNPTQGYIGNMQQRKQIAINVTTNQTYFWQVQTIDNGLKPGSWSTLQEYDPCPSLTSVNVSCYKYQKDLNENNLNVIRNTLTLDTTNLTTNSLTILSNLVTNNSKIIGNITINGSLVMDNTNHSGTLFLNSSTNNISNSFLDIIVLNNSLNNNIINTSFTSYNISNSSFNKRWKVKVILNDSSVTATVTVKDINNNQEDSASTISGIANFDVIEVVYNDSGVTLMNNHSFVVSADGYNTQTVMRNISDNTEININLTLSQIPTYNNFNSTLTTNFSNVSDLNNVYNASIGIENKGLINFTNKIDVAGLNLNNMVKIGPGYIYVDSVNAPGLDVNATLTMYNLSYNYTPVAMGDGVVCSDCVTNSYSGGNFSFNVTSFSNYSTASNSKLVLAASNRINNKPLVNQSIFFTANYTNRTSGVSINGTGVNCSISFGAGDINMTFNMTALVYDYNRTFNVTSTYNYNVSCLNNLGFENINLSSLIQIKINAVYFTLNQSLEGRDKNSFVLSDINSDGYVDLVIFGDNGAIAATYGIYLNNQSSFEINNSELITGLERGSLSLIDYDKDNDFDLFELGQDISASSAYKFYENK